MHLSPKFIQDVATNMIVLVGEGVDEDKDVGVEDGNQPIQTPNQILSPIYTFCPNPRTTVFQILSHQQRLRTNVKYLQPSF